MDVTLNITQNAGAWEQIRLCTYGVPVVDFGVEIQVTPSPYIMYGVPKDVFPILPEAAR